jgi:hypothetical protein
MKRLLTILLVATMVFAGGSLFFAEDAQAQLSLGLTEEVEVLNIDGDALADDPSPLLPSLDIKFKSGDYEAKFSYNMLYEIETYFKHKVYFDYLKFEYKGTLTLGWGPEAPLDWDFELYAKPTFFTVMLNAPIKWEFEAESKLTFVYGSGLALFWYGDPIKLNNILTFLDDGFLKFLMEIGTTYGIDSYTLGLPIEIEFYIYGIADMIDLQIFVKPTFSWMLAGGPYDAANPSSTIFLKAGIESDFHVVADVLDIGLDVTFELGDIAQPEPADPIPMELTIKLEIRYYLPVGLPFDGGDEEE